MGISKESAVEKTFEECASFHPEISWLKSIKSDLALINISFETILPALPL